MASHTDDTSGDNRDFTVIIYFNTSLEENDEKGTLRFHVPTFQDLDDLDVHEVDKNMNSNTRYSMYTTYRKK